MGAALLDMQETRVAMQMAASELISDYTMRRSLPLLHVTLEKLMFCK